MPVTIAEAFQPGGTPAAPASAPPGTGAPPNVDPGAPKPTGMSVLSAFPKPPPTVKDKVKAYKEDRIDPVIAGVKGGLAEFSNEAIVPYMTDLNHWAKEYSNALHEDVTAYPEGTGNQLLHSLKLANDALGYAFGPVLSPIYTGIINPVKAGIQKLGNLVKEHADPAAGDDSMQSRRVGSMTGKVMDSKTGQNWYTHRQEVQATVNDLQTASEALVNAATMFVAPERLAAIKANVPSNFVAGARVAVRDLKAATEPGAPKLEPISASLDKTVGFGEVAQNIGTVLEKLPEGSTRTVGSLIDDMLPHAQGYAKAFLEKLNKSINPSVPVKFKATAGNDPINLGVFMPEYNQIEIKVGGADMIHTVTHEMVHGATIHMLDTLMEADLKSAQAAAGKPLSMAERIKVIDKPSNPVVKELDAIIKEARTRAAKAGRSEEFYGLRQAIKPEDLLSAPGDLAYKRMSPRYEFVAEVMTNPKLQEFLGNSEKYASAGYKFQNIFTQLGMLIGKHLGISGAGELRLLNQAMRVSGHLMDLTTSERPPTDRSIVQIVGKLPDGTTITRGDIKIATTESARLVDRAAVRRAKTALQISIEGILRSVAPEALGRNAKLGAAVVASRISELMYQTSIWRHGSETRQNFWRARPDMVNEFLEKYEKGQPMSDPVLTDLARRYRDWNKNIFAQDMKIVGLDYEPRDNYLYHVFEDPEGVANYFTRKYGAKWGDPKFIKDRTFDLYKEAIAADFRPKYSNPEDIMLARQHASDTAAMQTGILKDLEKYGLATKKVKGGTFIDQVVGPDGTISWQQKVVKGTSQPDGTTPWRAPNGDMYWVDNKAYVILENKFKSKSLWSDKSGLGLGFRGMMAIKNAIVPIRLSASLFHPLHVTGIDVAAGWSRASADFMSGTISAPKALGRMLQSGFNPVYQGVRDGWRVMKVWRGKVPVGQLTAEDAEALKHITEGGMVPEMSSEYRTNARQNFGNAIRDLMADMRLKKPIGATGDALRATWHLPWALMSAMQAPIFEFWIPALKTASYLKDVKSILERNPALLQDDAARALALRKIAKSVDNRYGEMAYNTLFWKNYIKDVAVLDTLSLGWQLGFIREYGGGAIDIGQFAKGGNKLQRVREGQLDRPLFVAAYTTLGAMTAGLMTWGFTGEAPSSLLDYISPRTGDKNPDGSEQRVSTMFYSREFAALYKHIQNQGVVPGISQMVLNKGSGLFGLMHEWASGVNDFGQEIRDPDGDLWQKTEQTVAYTLRDLEPISMKSLQDNWQADPVKTGVLSVLGFTPAPKYLTESKTIADVKSAFNKYVAPKMTPYDKAQYGEEMHQLRQLYQSGDQKFGELLDSMADKYGLSAHDQRRLMKSLNSEIAPEVRMFMRLPWQEQVKLLDKMTPEEREVYLPHANREHVRNMYEAPQ